MPTVTLYRPVRVSEELDEFNLHIVGPIEVTQTFVKDG